MSYLLDIMKTRHNIQFFSDKVPDKDLIDDILKKAHLLVPHKNNFWYYKIRVYGPEHKKEKRLLGMASVGGEGKDKFRDGNEDDTKRLGEIYDEWHSDNNRKKGYPKIDGCNFNMQVTAPYLLVYTHQKDYLSKSQENTSYFKTGKQQEIFKKQFNKKNKIDWVIQASMHGISTAYICAENKLYASFCKCYFYNKFIDSNIIKDKKIEDTAFLLGIGYRDVFKPHFQSLVGKPEYNEIVEWQ